MKEMKIIIREIIKDYSSQIQETYVNYDDYLTYFKFLRLNRVVISQLMNEETETESEMKKKDEKREKEKKKTDDVANSAENAEDLLMLQSFIIIKLYSRTYNRNDCTFYSTTISEIVIYLCSTMRLVNATHLLKTAEYYSRNLKKTLDDCQISVVQQIT